MTTVGSENGVITAMAAPGTHPTFPTAILIDRFDDKGLAQDIRDLRQIAGYVAWIESDGRDWSVWSMASLEGREA